MSAEFWTGLLTLPVLAACALVLWLLGGLARRSWFAVHQRLLARVDLPPNPVAIRFRGDPAPEPRPKYDDAANRMRDALLASPRTYSASGLGWLLIAVRDYRQAAPIIEDTK